MWAIALALNATVAEGISVENFTYDNEGIADHLKRAIENVTFKGISVSDLLYGRLCMY